MYGISVKSPEGDKVELLTSSDENFAKGACAGIAALLKFLENDMEFEEGFTAEINQKFESNPSFWSYHSDKNSR